MKNKVFGLGLSKTGTSSLTRALTLLDYKSAHFIKIHNFDKYDAITDTPIPVIYRALDRQYPQAKFVLTIRDAEDWVKSFENHIIRQDWQNRYSKMRSDALLVTMQLYGTINFDRQKYLDGYHRYHQEVRDYFANRKQDLLVMNICQGDGWEKLCPFLGVSVPETPFPVKNAKKNITKSKQIASRLLHNIGLIQ
ncbi:MAG: sulfotransferase family protein [Cyanobacteria bacterium P01_G01_bin.19]